MGYIDKQRMILDKISMIRKAPSVILDKIFLINKAPSVMLNTATSFNDGEEKVVCGNTGLRNFRTARYYMSFKVL